MGATDWLNVPGKSGRKSAQSVEDALRDSAVAPNDPSVPVQDTLTVAPVESPSQQQPSLIRSTITARDNIRLRSWSSIAIKLRVAIRCLMANGDIKTLIATQQTGINRGKNALFITMPGGVLEILSASVSTFDAGCVRGQCFVTLAVTTSGPQLEESGTANLAIKHGESVVVRTLLQGYMVSGCTLQLGTFEEATGGRGFVNTIVGGATFTVPNGALWKVTSSVIQLVCSAVAGNRFGGLQIVRNGQTIFESVCEFPQAATVTIDFCATTGSRNINTGNPENVPLPVEMFMLAADTFNWILTAGQVGDLFPNGNATITYEEWIQPDEA